MIPTDFWRYGHKLFRSTPESFPVPFIRGDVLDANFLEERIPFMSETRPNEGPPALDKVESFNPLRGHVSAIFAGSFFHLFGEEQQTEIARKFGGLLSPEPGSMVIGSHAGRVEKGYFVPTGQKKYKIFCHSEESWRLLWEDILGRDNVEVQTRLRKEDGGLDFYGTLPGNTVQHYILEWSVVRK